MESGSLNGEFSGITTPPQLPQQEEVSIADPKWRDVPCNPNKIGLYYSSGWKEDFLLA